MAMESYTEDGIGYPLDRKACSAYVMTLLPASRSIPDYAEDGRPADLIIGCASRPGAQRGGRHNEARRNTRWAVVISI